MMKLAGIARVGVCLAVVLAIAGMAQATAITVPNYSFEVPDVTGDNKAAPGGTNITSWSSSTNASSTAHIGCWDTAISGVTGSQMAMTYISGADNGLWIKLTSALLAQSVSGYEYTASADLVNAASSWQPSDATVQLWVGGSNVAESSVGGSDLSFTTYSTPNYTATASGQDIFIQILIVGAGGSSNPNKCGMDNVQLDYVPEPASLGLLGLGALGVLLRKRRR